MNKKPNILIAVACKYGKLFHISHWLEDKKMRVLETGKYRKIGRRDFRKLCKENGWRILPQLKTGEYVNINTGEIEKLYGI